MKKMGKLKYIIFIFFILIFFDNVKAAQYYDGSTKSHSVGGCQLDYAYCWRTSGTAFMLQGVRVSAYNENAERISDIVDFTNDYNAISTINSSYYYTPNIRKNRVGYIQNPYVSRDISQPKIEFANFRSFIQANLTTNTSIQDIFLSSMVTIMDKTKICQGEYASICSDTQYWIFEPLTIIWSRKEAYDYYGTYYELAYLLGHSGYNFNGVSSFLPGNIAMSLYITGVNNEFSSFYKKVGLSALTKSQINTVSGYIKSPGYSSLQGMTTGISNVKYGFGVGVMLKNDKINNPPKAKGCEGNCNIPTCTVNKPKYDVCNQGGNGIGENEPSGVIEYSYENCPLTDSLKTYSIDFEEGTVATSGSYTNGNPTICQIQCNEKYYVEAWSLYNNLNPIGENGILAGSYIPINSPVVYHKKTCEYFMAEGKLEYFARQTATRQHCEIVSGAEECTTVFDEEEYNRIYNNYTNSQNNGKCDVLKKEYKQMTNNIEKIAENDSVGDLTLKLFSDYKLTATKTNTRLNNIDNKNYEYGYHNTFNYFIDGNVNKYIRMDNGIDANTDIADGQNVGDGIAKVTTPITLKEDTYNYGINFYNIFSNNSNFVNIISKKYPIREQLKETYCPYKIIQRKIYNVCVPSVNNNYCGGDPNKNFVYPKIKMIYRPINLNYPFPGKDGQGRTPGLNWQTVTEVVDGSVTLIKDYTSDYITNNRNVKTDQVYSKEPLYTIKLDSETIKKIREYNKNHAYDDFELECIKGTGTECLSKFLRGNMEDFQLNLITSGTCKDITNNSQNISNNNFYSCADK